MLFIEMSPKTIRQHCLLFIHRFQNVFTPEKDILRQMNLLFPDPIDK